MSNKRKTAEYREILNAIKSSFMTDSNFDDWACGNCMFITLHNPDKIMNLIKKFEKIKGNKL